MAAIANAIDFLTQGSSSLNSGVDHAGMKAGLVLCYVMTCCVLLATHNGSAGFSYTLFTGSTLQLLGILSLCLKVRGTKSAAGLSSQSLVLFGISLGFRLISTSLYEGYLPVDSSGDLMYQVIDGCTLLGVVYLLYATHKTYGHSYQEEYDTFPILPVLMPCLICGYFFHGDLNHCDLFDTLWAFSLNVETFQLLPQLFMLAKVGGLVDRTTAHFVANTFLACVFRTAFWVWAISGCPELSTEDGIDMPWNMEVGGNHILLMHGIQLIVLLDFMYYYVKAWRGGTSVYLPRAESIEC